MLYERFRSPLYITINFRVMDAPLYVVCDFLALLCVATYPSAGGRRETRGMRVPRKEYARSRHQCLFEDNVIKFGMV